MDFRFVFFSTFVFSLGCQKIEESPPELGETFQRIWRNFDGDEAAREEAIVDLVGLIDLDAIIEEPIRGAQLPLEAADLEVVDFFDADGGALDAPDPSTAIPLHLMNPLDCSVEEYLPILTYPDQNELYGKYESYARDYHVTDDELSSFNEGEFDQVSWSATIGAKILVYPEYLYECEVDAVHVAVPPDLGLLGDRVVLSRTWIPRAVEWEGNNRWDQDYLLEIIIPYSEEQSVQLSLIWRDFEISGIGTLENDGLADITLDQMWKWAKDTSAMCDEGIPTN